ncbi:hypothetical protein PGTUg99_016574 [Puccinia graminis f. sp. tritici]|uniref:Secreted protein n=1 Tax=Puccinia graminis f. sp. tritici TaxID=56615 RepID=A0A5B0LMX0_PUCGR|nr:hypothetical protein PGTUg99_016574 [Puccinia graminis f. sp. tritici]
MQVTTTAVLLVAFALSGLTTAGQPNSQCYSYFFKTSGSKQCVPASQYEPHRCKDTKGASHELQETRLFSVQNKKKRSEEHTLERRYDNYKEVSIVTRANMAYRCPRPSGKLDPSWNYGVCLWAGSGKGSSGWVDDNNHRNCGKKVYIQRRGQPGTVIFARVVGGCDFGKVTEDAACFNLAVGPNLFRALNPTAEEKNQHKIKEVSWDFDNLKGQSSKDGAA